MFIMMLVFYNLITGKTHLKVLKNQSVIVRPFLFNLFMRGERVEGE